MHQRRVRLPIRSSSVAPCHIAPRTTSSNIVAVASLAVSLALLTAHTAAAQVESAAHIVVDESTVLLPSHEFGVVAGAALASDGSVYVLDHINSEILKLGAAGNLTWRRGRKGEGPGEYRLPYRIAARPKGGVAVLDWGIGRVTLLSADGNVDETHSVPFPFTQFDGFEVLPDGRFIVAGMTIWGGTAANHSVHVFTDSMRYEYSFAPLAQAEDSASVRYVGSGGFRIYGDQIHFTRKRPYDIHEFELTGRPVRRTPIKVALALELDDMIEVKQFNNQTFKSITPQSKDVEVPIPAQPLPIGGYIGGRATFTRTTVDLISNDGRILSSIDQPAGCSAILAIDVARSTLYCSQRGEVPTLVRVKYSITPSRR